MLRDEVIDLLLARAGGRTGDARLRGYLEAEIAFLQDHHLDRGLLKPWFMETETTSATCTEGEERLPVPSDFLEEIEEDGLWLYDETEADPWVPLQKGALDALRGRYPGTGRPRAYALRGDAFILKPTPDDAYTLKMRYIAKSQSLSSNVESVWLAYAPDVVAAELGLIMARQYLRDDTLAQAMERDKAEAWHRLIAANSSRAEANRARTMDEE